ncbi:carboxymuconolactone decarboxylase family protein [Helicobacter mesocricetorum]|uniref:carboxymuconolactone decarboxylase family protein n=1 Tax=Helicobacter mesocricetorum TaxID=87012 RepID=UPI000CF046DA|nr:carboxymuconolactone decarboxylase family protein [Helicobacter mesocricetorum]
MKAKLNNKRRKLLKTSFSLVGLGLVGTNLIYAKETARISKKTQDSKHSLNSSYESLKQTDPEFFSNHTHFAFEEVSVKSNLEEREHLMIILASLIAIPALSEYKSLVQIALDSKVSPVAIKEILYQATPYVGMGKVIDFIHASNEIFVANNIALPLQPQGTTTKENRKEKGLSIQRKLFGDAIDRGNSTAPADVKHIREFLSANCFGDYYTRGGIDLKFRELLTFVYILSMGGAQPQLIAHVSGNLKVGNDRAKLIATITALIPYIGYPRSLNALSAVDEIIPAS